MKNDYLKIRIEKDLYEKFQEKCKSKNKTISEVLRSFINSYTENENTILLHVDKKTLNDTVELCKEKKLKLNELIIFLLNKAIKNKEKLNFK